MSGKLTRVNRFSKEYYLYPEEMRQAERRYQEQLQESKEQKQQEERSKRAHIANLEHGHSQDINRVLADKGFFVNHLPTNAEWLPINIFDDDKYDLFTPSEWLALYHNNGDPIEFRGKALLREKGGELLWQPVRVQEFDTTAKKWLVETANGARVPVFRVNLVFNSENKAIFSMRFIQAYSERIFLDSFIRYNFYVDAMPTTGMPAMSPVMLKAILTSSRGLRTVKTGILSDKVLAKTVESFFGRTYNKILFNEQMRKQKEIFALKNQLILPDDFLEAAERKERGLVALPRNTLRIESKVEGVVYPASMEFKENFKLFCLNSVYAKKPVLRILKEIEEANKRIFDLPVFDCNFVETQTFDSFRNCQESTITKFMNHCKINWLKDVLTSVTRNLKDETSGWFNLKSVNMDNYKVGKLRALLATIDLKLGDMLTKIVRTHFTRFIQGFLDHCPEEVLVIGSNDVENVWKEPPKTEQPVNDESKPTESHMESQNDSNYSENDEKAYEKYEFSAKTTAKIEKLLAKEGLAPLVSVSGRHPLFQITAKMDENQIVFQETPDMFEEFICLLTSKSLDELNKLTRIEEQVLKSNLDNKNESCISCPNLKEPNAAENDDRTLAKTYDNPNRWLINLFDSLKTKLAAMMAPVIKYLEFYKILEKEFAMTPAEFVANFEAKNKGYTIQNLLDEVGKIRRREAELLRLFPDMMHVSLFRIENTEVQNRIRDVANETEREIYRLIEDKGKTATAELLTKSLKALKQKMKERPKTVEEMSALNEYLQGQLTDELAKVCEQIEELREVYGVLEQNKIKVASEDMKKFWMVVGGPKEILDARKALQTEFVGLRGTFEKELGADQVKFQADIEAVRRSFETFAKNHDVERHQEIFLDATIIHNNLQELIRRAQVYNNRESLLQKKASDYSGVFDFEKAFKPLYNFWRVVHTWFASRVRWMQDPWDKVDALEAESFATEGLQTIVQSLNHMADTDKKGFEKLMRNATGVRKEIEDFGTKVPLLVALKREGMTDRHWALISERMGGDPINPATSLNFTFQHILDLGLLQQKAFCVGIGERAAREHEIEKALKKMYEKWNAIEIETVPFKREDLLVVKTFDKVESELDEDFSTTNGMLVNPFRGPFEAEITRWNDQLLLVSNLVEEWRRFQAQWAYLQPIFDSPDISRQLPAESNLFKKIDLFYKQFLLNASKTQNMLRIAGGEAVLERVCESNADLELIQKELNNYLEVKRGKFARFYFLSNDELLSILSETKEVTKIQNHLRKVFENLGALVFNAKKQIVGMKSLEGEEVSFSAPVNPLSKQVEDWMTDVETQMVAAMKRELKQAVVTYDSERKSQWILEHPGQCVLNGWQTAWTSEVEEAVMTNRLAEYLEKTRNELLKIVVMPRTNLTSMNVITIEALIVIEVHALDVVENLIKKKVNSPSAFEWISQLRYYLVNDVCQVRCIQTEFPYGYEYLGNTSRLVITPLTDKCYMTLMGALRLNLGGAPAGPAGTGKTETTKDLAKALAKQCVVFNCQESMDYLFLAKFFKGLASSGAWCCFDEFNRINIEVLSVIAQQLQDLFRAKAERVKEMRFEDTIIKVESTFSVYITMNPGYAGRTELPDNLKALFRAVAMMVPDYALIAQIKLYSFGFTKARELSQKMVDTFKLCSEQLSNQKHYDYGMRAVTSVINAAGLFKQLYGANEGMSEEQLLYKALLDVNVPKFMSEDIPLFSNIIKDLFPDLVPLNQRNLKLADAVQMACRNLNMQPEKRFLEKIMQLYDTIQVRHGLMLVGPTGGGKTACYKVLQGALNIMAQNNPKLRSVKTDLINPKAMSLVELYGESRDLNWVEGVIEMVMEHAIKESQETTQWVMFDGPVDAVWIESMNTVLDDNKKLCLASGKVLILTPSITMMFEVEDLLVASPATVSRCGMVYMDLENVSFKYLFQSYLNTLPDEVLQLEGFEDKFSAHIDQILFASMEYHAAHRSADIFDVPDVIVVQGFIRLFDSLIQSTKESKEPAALATLARELKNLIVFCTVWSVGCLGDAEARAEFEQHFLQHILEDAKLGRLFELEFDLNTAVWKPWNAAFENYEVPAGSQFHDIVIPTMDFARGVKLNQTLLFNRNSVLVPGSVGSGKTICAFRLFSDYLHKDFNSLSLAFSARTTPKQLMDYFFSQVEKRKKGVFGPKNGKKSVIFLDDLNMPLREEWGAQPPLELLRQYMDHGAWHVMKLNKEYTRIEDVVLLGAMVPPKAGRNDVSRRLVRHFNVIPFTDFEEKTLQSIYEKILSNFLMKRNPETKPLIASVVSASIEVFRNAASQLLPTPSKSHYIFNLRDLAKTINGITTLQSEGDPTADIWKLWFHENERAYADRLCDTKDAEKLALIMGQALAKFSQVEAVSLTTKGPLIYSALCSGVYSQVEDSLDLVKSVERLLDRYNSEALPKNQMKLVMFLDACKYISRMARALQSPQGHVLILGVGGSGRQSLSRLSAYACGLKPFQVEPTKGYNVSKWKDDLKRLFIAAVCDNSSLGFILSDLQIIHESFLEDINALLNTGLLVGLPLLPDEVKRLDDAGKAECQKRNLQATKMNILSCQIGILKQNLHILLSMSPAHEKFPQRVRMFPSLVNCCSLNWLHRWPEEALEGVAKQFLAQNMEVQNVSATVDVLKSAHEFVEELSGEFLKATKRVSHLTSTSYLELLNTYKRVFNAKNLELVELLNRFETGVQKLFEANKQVEDIRDHLRSEEPKLKVAEVEVKELLQKVAVDKEAENETKKVVALEEAEAAAQQLEANTLKKSAEESVRLANEELERTLEKIQLLKPASIIEIRTANNPVRKLKLVIMTVCYLLLDNAAAPGFMKKNLTEEEFWTLGKNNLLNDPGKLFQTLMAPETKDNIELARVRKVGEIVKKNLDLWNEKEMKNSSLATYYLFLWVDCILNYMEINEKTRPIREKLQEVTRILDEKTAFLEKKKAELDASTKRLKELEDLYTEKINLKEELFRMINECNIKLQRASKLTTLLEDETGRWQNEIVRISGQIKLVANDSLFVACQMAYFGPFDLRFRGRIDEFLTAKMASAGLQVSAGLRMVSFMSNPIEVLNWNIQGLPKDETSVVNGILINKSQKWPLMIDPQGRAGKFIKNLGRGLALGLEVLKANSPGLIRQLEQAIQLGKWVLLENVGVALDPLLEPLLLQRIFSVSGGKAISLGDKMIPYHESFRFLMSTSLQNPEYSPEVFSKVIVVNFCITPAGLEEHLLAQIMLFENRELENRKTEIVVVNADDKQRLKEIEDNILGSLRESKGDVLMDESLITRLTQAKKTFGEINHRIAEATTTEKEIDEVRERYRDSAYYASALYFLVSELFSIDPMYQYSLQWFETLFQATLEQSPPSNELATRLLNIRRSFVQAVYENVCVSLYSQHKLLFAFLLAVRTLMAYGQIDVAKYNYFLVGSLEEIKMEYPAPDFIPESSWQSILKELLGVNRLANCEGILDSLISDPNQWRHFYESQQPENEELPGNWDSLLDDFDRLLVLKALRLDKLSSGIQKFIQRKIGDKFVEAPIFRLEDICLTSTAVQPLIFMISSGADPKADFDALSLKNGIKSVSVISLGQGQGPKAGKMIKEASKLAGEGGWVLLQNCHLAISWLPKLEAICEEFSPETMHPDFRLWMTTMPCQAFPVSILRNSKKMTIEPPKSFKATLKITYNQIDNKVLDSCAAKPDEFRKLLFGLTMFHAVIQERKKYGSIGWNIPYEFTLEDFHVCRRQLQSFLNEYQEIPFKVLNFVFAEINYGGRVTDDKDTRLINALIRAFVSPSTLQPGHCFSKDPRYFSVQGNAHNEYLNYIESLPLYTSPEVMGLHPNSEIMTNQNESKTLLRLAKAIQPNSGGGATQESDSQTLELIAEVETRIPASLDLPTIKTRFSFAYEDSLNTVLVQEADKFNQLLSRMRQSIANLKLAVAGLIVLNPDLEAILKSITNYAVPSIWSQTFLSLKPLFSWMDELKERVGFFASWCGSGTPQRFWFNAFSFPQAFLTAIMQNYARKTKIAIDKLTFDFKMTDTCDPGASLPEIEAGVYIYGVFLEGMSWDFGAKELQEAIPNELYSKAPVIWLIPVLKEGRTVQNSYLCPLYKTLTRSGTLTTTGHSSNFVMMVSFPTSIDTDHWTRRGAACFLALRD